MSVSLTRTTVRTVQDIDLDVIVKPEYVSGEFRPESISERLVQYPDGVASYEVTVHGHILKKDGSKGARDGKRTWGSYRSGFSTLTDIPAEIAECLEGPNRLAVATL